jgi:hypothetical protein
MLYPSLSHFHQNLIVFMKHLKITFILSRSFCRKADASADLAGLNDNAPQMKFQACSLGASALIKACSAIHLYSAKLDLAIT